MDIKSISLAVITFVVSNTVNAALLERLGGLAYYDDVANLTWLADANAAGTAMNWADADNWAAALEISGVSGWRLAESLQPDPNCDNQYGAVSYGFNCSGGELGDLFYNALENSAGSLVNTGPFNNVQSGLYWTSTVYAYDPAGTWAFDMSDGSQNSSWYRDNSFYAWAVQSGDVSAVPVPAAAWLFGSGLLALSCVARRRA